jgi:serine/threonine protein kinase
MESPLWPEIDAIFTAAAELTGEARAAFVAAGCAGRPDLQAEVESLLAAHDRADTFLETLVNHPPLGVPPGTMLGPYRLVERIGEGGMANVYRAERVDGTFEQQVAVKIAHAIFRDEESSRRFRAERQILAELRHPHIVTLLDGGTFQRDQPYLVMELVDGTPITRESQASARSIEARLRIFRDVCAAVQYAHSHGVVHRDLKPANVLVTRDGMVKVLDFGVAKLLEAERVPGHTLTRTAPAPLTMNYASPEQLRGTAVTTASDVYALGVLLYEMVTGQRPYEIEGLPLDEVLAVVLDTTPPKPSTTGRRRYTAISSAEAPSLPYDRRRLRGDLDAIVLKALAKEPERRYASAGELGDDIGRFLAGQPVLAREPSAWYMLRKLAGRHRVATIVAGLALVSVLAALGLALRERTHAERSLSNVRRIANTVIFDLDQELAAVPGATPVRQRLLSEAIKYLELVAPDAARDPALALEIARGYRKVARVLGTSGVENLGDVNGAIAHYGRARAMLLPLVDVPELSVEAVEELITVNGLMTSTLASRTAERRLDLVRESVTHAERLLAQAPRDVKRRKMLGDAWLFLASQQGREESLPTWARAAEQYEGLLSEHPDDLSFVGNVAGVAKSRAEVLRFLGRNEEAEPLARHSVALEERRLAASPGNARILMDLGISSGTLGSILDRRGNYAEALKVHARSLEIRQQLAAADPRNVDAQTRLGASYNALAFTHRHLKQYRQSHEYATRAVRTIEPVARESIRARMHLLNSYENLTLANVALGRLSSGCASWRKAAAIAGALLGSKAAEHDSLTAWAPGMSGRCAALSTSAPPR